MVKTALLRTTFVAILAGVTLSGVSCEEPTGPSGLERMNELKKKEYAHAVVSNGPGFEAAYMRKEVGAYETVERKMDIPFFFDPPRYYMVYRVKPLSNGEEKEFLFDVTDYQNGLLEEFDRTGGRAGR